MQLIHVDAVQPQFLQAPLDRFAKVRWTCLGGPLIRAGTVPASLGGNYKASRVWKQRFGNQFLAYVWAVGTRSINEIDIKLVAHSPCANGFYVKESKDAIAVELSSS